MASQELLGNPNDMWANLGRFADIDDPELLWREIAIWLMDQTGARGTWLDLRAPIRCQFELGYLDDLSRRWLQTWPGPDSPGQTSQGWLPIQPPGRDELWYVGWSYGLGQDGGNLVLAFDGGAAPAADLPEVCAAVKVLAGLAARVAEARQSSERYDRFRHLHEVGQAIASTLDLHQVLRQSTERVTEVLHAEASTLLLIDEERQELVFEIPAGPAEDMLREQRMPLNKGVAGWAATRGEPVIIQDTATDARFYTDIDRMTGYRTQSIMAVPLQVQGRTIGVVEVINKVDGRFFSAEDQQWLSTLAPIIAAAVENARLFTALREERDRIVAAEENVRHELARNLHDGPAQIMAAMILNIDMARRHLASGPDKMATELNFLDSLAQEANQEIRDLLFSLRPLTLETHGLTAALEQLAERLRSHVSYELHLDFGLLPDRTLDVKLGGTLFVIVQEALNNIQKHAKATHVWVRTGVSDAVVWVEVEDDGVGFDVKLIEANYARLNSFGLLNMRERARLIDGHTEIWSPVPGKTQGTKVRVEVPRERAARTANASPQ